jgi:cell shape-determining protein MreC
MMAAIFLVLAVVDAALLANVALTNTSASSLSVFDQSMARFTQGELLLVAAGLGLLLALFLRIAWSSSSARRAKRRQLRAARREVESRVAELERDNARLRKELEGTQRPGALVGPRGASSEAP